MRARQLHKLGIAAALALVVVLATALSALAEGGIGTTLQSSTMIGYARWKTVYGWTIDKSAAPATWELFAGDSGTSNYIIAVTRDAGTNTVWMDGNLCITNGGAVATENLAVTAVLRYGESLSSPAINTVPVDVSSNPVLDPGEQGCWNYSVDIPAAWRTTGHVYRVDAGLTITNYSGHLGVPYGPILSATSVLQPATAINGSINVDDTNGSSWQFSQSGSVSYAAAFTCPADEGAHNNTATIRETGQADSAGVQVNCFALTVSKTASPFFTRTYQWDIAQQGSTLNLFRGDSGVGEYSVAVTQTGYTDSNWGVAGTITVSNPAPREAVLTGVTDSLAPVNCPTLTVPAQGSLTCTYSGALPDSASRTNTATASLQNTGGGSTDFSGAANVVFGAPATEVNKSITVSANGGGWTFQGSGRFTVPSRTFTCPDQDLAGSTATIDQTGQSALGRITVNCYDLAVSQTASPSYQRAWAWTIRKSADAGALTLSVGQQYLVNYTVAVDAGYTDSGWMVDGQIAITNPAPLAAPLAAVTGSLASATVNCPSLTVPAAGSLTCTYHADLSSAASFNHTATASLRNNTGGVTDFSASAPVGFGAPVETDECVNVSDTVQGFLGTVCRGSQTFTYSRLLSYAACGEYQAPNSASFQANDTQATSSANWTVNVYVPCASAGGCTLGLGYWKNHAGFTGRNPDMLSQYLPVWLGTGLGQSVVVTSASQAVTTFQFDDDASNGINKLYAHLLTTKLNIASGASASAVAGTLADADVFLEQYAAADWDGLTKTQQAQALSWKSIFEAYNEGLIGPGHCSQ